MKTASHIRHTWAINPVQRVHDKKLKKYDRKRNKKVIARDLNG